jgi:Rrf2 family iron-sulfur cluster assembly transcriptional regulator
MAEVKNNLPITMNNKFDHLLHLLGVVVHCPPNQTMTAQQLADALGLSISYVESLIKDLRLSGMVSSVRGPGGGYVAGPNLAHANAGDVLGISQGEDKTVKTDLNHATPAHQTVAEIAAQLDHIKHTFLHGYALSNLFNQGRKMEFNQPLNKNGVGPAPYLQTIRPDAPNSIFDLARFHRREMHGARA